MNETYNLEMARNIAKEKCIEMKKEQDSYHKNIKELDRKMKYRASNDDIYYGENAPFALYERQMSFREGYEMGFVEGFLYVLKISQEGK